MTQTLQVIYDFRSAVREAHRILRPGGVLLLTVPSLSKLAQYPSDYWRFTPAACSMLFESVFGPGRVDVQSYGNVLTGIGALAGLAREELSPEELDTHDEMFPVLVAVRAVKAVRPALVTSGGVDSADLPPKLGSVLQRSEPEGENRGIKPESVPQEPERLATVMRGLISPGARVLVIGDRGDTARAMPETGYRLSGGTADSAAPREDQTVLKHVTLEAIDSGHLMGKLESERFDVAFVLNFPHRFDDARSLVEMLRTLLLPEGYLVVLAPVAGASAPTEQWTHRKLHELLQDAAWATAKLEQRWIEFTGETPNKVSQSVSLSAEVLFAVAYPFSDRELRSMLRGFRHLAAGREAEQNNVAAQLARRDAELDTLQAELKSRKAELEIVYGSKTWRLATLYWKARQKVR